MIIRLALGEDLASEPFTRLLFGAAVLVLQRQQPPITQRTVSLAETETSCSPSCKATSVTFPGEA